MSLMHVGQYLKRKVSRLYRRDHSANIYYHGDKTQMGYRSQVTDVSFFEAVSTVFQVAQFVTIFPIHGLRQRSPSTLRFRWVSPQICISAIFIVFGVVMGGCEFAIVAEKKISPSSLVKVLYYLDNTSSYLFFVLLARKWKPIMCTWREKELVFLKRPYTIKRYQLNHSINVLAFGIIFFAGIVEHLFYITQSFYAKMLDAANCNITVPHAFNYYFQYEFSNIYQTVPYNLLWGCAIQIHYSILAMTWLFSDIFLIIVSIGISRRFEQLNARLHSTSAEVTNDAFWTELRKNYLQILDIVELANQNFSPIIFVSSFNNFYFICYQLIALKKAVPYLINKIYVFYGTGLLVFRMLIVYTYASNINGSSLLPLKVIKYLPISAEHLELKRFYDQLRFDSVALSASDIFTFKRGIILAMVGTIVTYEIVLLQNELSIDYGNATAARSYFKRYGPNNKMIMGLWKHLKSSRDHLAVMLTKSGKIYVEEIHQIGRQNAETSFHQSTAIVFTIARCVGILPIKGLRSPHSSDIRFSWLCPLTWISALFFLLGNIFAFCEFVTVVQRKVTTKTLVKTLYFFMCSLAVLFFFLLAKKWSTIVTNWERKEAVFLKKPYQKLSRSLKSIITRAASVIILLGLIEHTFYMIQAVYSKLREAKECNVTISDPVHYFLMYENENIFRFLPYHFVLGFMVQFLNSVLSFSWIFTDTFIIVISLGISTRFQQLYMRIKNSKNLLSNEGFWAEIRKDYLLILDIVDLVNNHLPPIIFVSCTINFYFICYHLISLSRSSPFVINKVYVYYTIVMLIVRMLTVYLYASMVNDTSLLPLKVINRLPISYWNLEIRRLYNLLCNDKVALSGLGFFSFTRSIILSVAGQIATYLIVMLQHEFGVVYQQSQLSHCGWIEKVVENIIAD